MQITLIAIGRMKTGPERELAARYLERATGTGKQLGLSGFDVIELPESRASSVDARKTEEAKAIVGALPDNAVRVALDERGKSLTSEQFAGHIARWRDAGKQHLALIIGGADGLDHRFLADTDLCLAFSELTWPHQLVRIMLAEQLYRAATILAGHPYHRGR